MIEVILDYFANCTVWITKKKVFKKKMGSNHVSITNKTIEHL